MTLEGKGNSFYKGIELELSGANWKSYGANSQRGETTGFRISAPVLNKVQVSYDSRSYGRNFSNCEEKPEKKNSQMTSSQRQWLHSSIG